MFNFNDIAKIGGWLTEKEGFFLYSTARKVKKENFIVEIGSWRGKSTICLGKGSIEGNKPKVYAIDPHVGSSEHQKKFGKVDTFDSFKDNIKKAGVDNYVTPIRDTSENAAKSFTDPVEFVFIDGAHEFRFVRLDFKLWFPKIINGGSIAFHDSWHYFGPHLASAIPLLVSSKVNNPKLIDTITYFEKVEKNSYIDRINNVIFLISRLFFGVIGSIEINTKGAVFK